MEEIVKTFCPAVKKQIGGQLVGTYTEERQFVVDVKEKKVTLINLGWKERRLIEKKLGQGWFMTTPDVYKQQVLEKMEKSEHTDDIKLLVEILESLGIENKIDGDKVGFWKDGERILDLVDGNKLRPKSRYVIEILFPTINLMNKGITIGLSIDEPKREYYLCKR